MTSGARTPAMTALSADVIAAGKPLTARLTALTPTSAVPVLEPRGHDPNAVGT
jgi:hypothetical protein